MKRLQKFARSTFELIKKAHSKEGGPTIGGTLSKTAMGVTGAKQLVKSLACGDTPCTIVSTVGIGCDVVQLGASYIPGCKVIEGVACSVSVSCKWFVFACDGGLSPWNKFCKPFE